MEPKPQSPWPLGNFGEIWLLGWGFYLPTWSVSSHSKWVKGCEALKDPLVKDAREALSFPREQVLSPANSLHHPEASWVCCLWSPCEQPSPASFSASCTISGFGLFPPGTFLLWIKNSLESHLKSCNSQPLCPVATFLASSAITVKSPAWDIHPPGDKQNLSELASSMQFSH